MSEETAKLVATATMWRDAFHNAAEIAEKYQKAAEELREAASLMLWALKRQPDEYFLKTGISAGEHAITATAFMAKRESGA